MPTDPDVYAEMADEMAREGGHFWNDEELGNHYTFLWEMLQGIDGLEFKIYRQDIKELLVKFLNNVPEYYEEVRITGESEPLPACLKTGSVEVPGDYNDIGEFGPAALLGIFYEMDGRLEDAKKCFKIQTEVSSDFKTDIGNQKDYWQNRTEEIDQQIRMGKQKSLIEKQTDEESKKPQTSQQQDQTSLQAIRTVAFNFELKDLRTYAFSKIPKPEMTEIIKTKKWYGHSTYFCKKCEQDVYRESWRKKYCERCDECKKPSTEDRQCNECKKQTTYRKKTLYDKVKEMQAKEENDTILPIDPTYWDYLDLSDKIKILIPYINKNTINYLQYIRRHRNLTEHPKYYKKEDLEQRNKMIMLYIKECIDYFEKSERR
jgi:hypothetical protein